MEEFFWRTLKEIKAKVNLKREIEGEIKIEREIKNDPKFKFFIM